MVIGVCNGIWAHDYEVVLRCRNSVAFDSQCNIFRYPNVFAKYFK